MENTVGLIGQYFLLSLSLGMGFFSLIVNPKETGIGFIKLLNIIALVSLAILFISVGADYFTKTSLPYYVGIALFGLGQFVHHKRKSVIFWTLFGAQNFILLFLFYNLLEINNYLSLFYLLTGSFLLGVITYAMLLGHWYLVVPKLHEKYIKRAMIIFWILFGFKILFSSMGLFKGQNFFTSGTQLGMGHTFNWILLVMRVTWGYMMLAVLGVFTWKLIKIRSIQSATGILYVMTFLVFAGELIAGFFYYKYGLYL